MIQSASKKVVAAALVSSLLSACAVSPFVVSDAENRARDAVDTEKSRLGAQARALPLVEFVDVNYLGDEPIPLTAATALPRAFLEKQIQLLNTKNVKEHAERIGAIGGFAVRIAQDVWRVPAARSSAQGSAAMGPISGSVVPSASPSMVPSASGMPPGNPLALSQRAAPTPQSVALAPVTNYADPASVRMDYAGNLAGALDALTVPLGLTWEYNAEGNVVTISRFVTRRFAIRAGGTTEVSSDIDKGITANTGSTGGTGAGANTTSGNFSAGSKYRTESGKVEPLSIVAQTIAKNYLTPDGTVTADPSTNTVVVTDSKYVIDQIAAYVEQQNESLGRQVQVTVRTITLQRNNTSQLAFDVSMVYSKLAGGAATWAASTVGPSTLASTDAGTVAFNVVSPTSRFNGTSISLDSLDSIGKIIGDNTKTLVAKNRQATARIEFDSDAYLAKTEAGGGSLTGSAVPGLTPGNQTVGNSIIITPTIYDSKTVNLQMSLDESYSRGFRTAGAGQGTTLQQVELPRESGNKNLQSVDVQDGQPVVLVGYDTEKLTADRRYSVGGASTSAIKSQVITIVIVTARVLPGV
ncbi:hypothetical protein FX016_23040 [Cupriavidus gilardii]|nr:hypothetical protein FX016_23040 [Cupriavidus gilardii]